MDEAFRRTLARSRRVLFLCSGNMIRSAFAELLARHLGCARAVASAATTYRNHGLHPIARRALLARGLDRAPLDAFRSRHVDELPPVAPDTLVLGMTHEHLAAWRGRGPEGFLLTALEGRADEIEDPLFTGRDEVLDDVARCVEVLCSAGAPRGAASGERGPEGAR